MPRQLGQRFGECLDRYSIGLEAALGSVDQESAVARERAQARLEAATEGRNSALSRSAGARGDLGRRQEAFEGRVDERNAYPTNYSLLRGFFFIGVAVVLLAGDLTVLSVVLTRILGFSFRSDAGSTTLQVSEIVNHPLAGWQSFRSVIVLTLSVLLLGFFPKIFFDIRHEKFKRGFTYGMYIVLALSLLTVITTSAARYGTHPRTESIRQVDGSDANGGQRDQTAESTGSPRNDATGLFGIASVLLGIALPYVSCFFFVSGTDRLANRFELWRLSWRVRSASAAVKRDEQNAAVAIKSLAEAEQEAKRLESPDYDLQKRRVATADFSQGYAEGAAAIVRGTGPGTVFAALQAIAIRRRLR